MNRLNVALVIILIGVGASSPQEWDWSSVSKVLAEGVADGAFPGCVAIVGDRNGHIFSTATGHFTYGTPPPLNHNNPPMQLDTLFDLASCSKVTGALSAVAQFYQRGELDLESYVTKYLPHFGQNGKGPIKIIHLLVHSSGFPPDPSPNYYDPEFGCPETREYRPQEVFTCRNKIWNSVMAQTLENPINTKYVYSDLNFITLAYIVGILARDLKYIEPSQLLPSCLSGQDPSHPEISQCYFEAYVRIHVFENLKMKNTNFLPEKSLWKNCAPADNDTTYHHGVVQGQVSDDNCYAMGGIAGHAGIFSTAGDLATLAHRVLFAEKDDHSFINKTTADYFIKEYNHSQSSRAIGWNTNDPTVFDFGWDQDCGSLSPKTFTHVGYAGTQICGDPDRKIYTVFLTNRVYPSVLNEKIQIYRKAFNTAVAKLWDSHGNGDSSIFKMNST